MTDSVRVAVPIDGGPVYHETDLSQFIAEPWNAISSLVFLVPVFIFLWKLRGNYRKHLFIIAFCAPLLLAGGLGSTLFHAFRSTVIFLILDVLPIVILTMGVSIYFLYRISGNWYIPAVVILASFGLRWLTSEFFQGQDAINIYYAITGSLIFIPAIVYLIRTKGSHWPWIAATVVLFILALLFRFIDDMPDPGMPVGTHWLWHVFCASGAYALGMYIIKTSGKDEEEQEIPA